MNRPRNESVAHSVHSRVVRGGTDRLWIYADFPNVGRAALAAALSRLARSGELVRVRRGVYYRPARTVFGVSKPDPTAFADAVLRARGERSIPTGVGAYNRFGLTTQMGAVVSRATRKRVAENAVPGVRLLAMPRPLDKQKGIRAGERAALDALRDVRRIPGAFPVDIVRRIGALVGAGDLDFSRLVRYAAVEPPRVRALLGAMGETLRDSKGRPRVRASILDDVRTGLNPLTSFRIPGVRKALGEDVAARWQIR